jgi:transcriptional regulator with XRE-family HTH domain
MRRKTEKWDMSPARKEPDKTSYAGRFAIRLRKLREDAGLSVIEVAEAMGVTPTTVYDWESTKSQPQISQLPQIAGVLGVSIRTLMAKN